MQPFLSPLESFLLVLLHLSRAPDFPGQRSIFDPRDGMNYCAQFSDYSSLTPPPPVFPPHFFAFPFFNEHSYSQKACRGHYLRTPEIFPIAGSFFLFHCNEKPPRKVTLSPWGIPFKTFLFLFTNPLLLERFPSPSWGPSSVSSGFRSPALQ